LGERKGHQPCSRRHVEDPLTGSGVNRLNQCLAPAGILAETHHGAHAVVAGWQAREELERVTLPRGRGAVDWRSHRAIEA
jgi:hypothetical protein